MKEILKQLPQPGEIWATDYTKELPGLPFGSTPRFVVLGQVRRVSPDTLLTFNVVPIFLPDDLGQAAGNDQSLVFEAKESSLKVAFLAQIDMLVSVALLHFVSKIGCVNQLALDDLRAAVKFFDTQSGLQMEPDLLKVSKMGNKDRLSDSWIDIYKQMHGAIVFLRHDD